ncbi:MULTISPECIES: hypothetical protein [Virgibacillus]|nr:MULTISPECIES: hypothetical protein [Virgibacillus]NWO14732.1 hypothetical protein [Virgibacillus sp.]
MKKKKLLKAEASYTKLNTSTKPIVLASSPSVKKGMFRKGGCCGKAK